MSFASRTLLLAALLLALSPLAACEDEDGHLKPRHVDGGAAGTSGTSDGGDAASAGSGGAKSSSLPRPGLSRPPTKGLPPELRPPR